MTDFQDSSPSPTRPKGWGYRQMPGVGNAADYNDTEPSAPSPLGEPGQLPPLPSFWRRIAPLGYTVRDYWLPTIIALVALIMLLLLIPAAGVQP